MRHVPIAVAAAGAIATAVVGTALAKGSSPQPSPDPQPYTIVATGAAQRPVVAPARRTDATIERAVRAARARALPAAVAAARNEATQLGAAAGLRPGATVAIRRDVALPPYYGGTDAGRFGPGRWCGRLYAGRRRVTGEDGRTRLRARFRQGCSVPKDAQIHVTISVAVPGP